MWQRTYHGLAAGARIPCDLAPTEALKVFCLKKDGSMALHAASQTVDNPFLLACSYRTSHTEPMGQVGQVVLFPHHAREISLTRHLQGARRPRTLCKEHQSGHDSQFLAYSRPCGRGLTMVQLQAHGFHAIWPQLKLSKFFASRKTAAWRRMLLAKLLTILFCLPAAIIRSTSNKSYRTDGPSWPSSALPTPCP